MRKKQITLKHISLRLSAFIRLKEFLLFKKEVLEDIGEIKSNLERLIKSLNDSL